MLFHTTVLSVHSPFVVVAALEVQDWLSELYSTFPDDTVPVPKMKPIPDRFDEAQTPRVAPSTPAANQSGKQGSSHASPPPPPGYLGGGTASPSPVRPGSAAFDKQAGDNWVRRSGMLSKRNATGFRNWKKVLFTLGRTKLSWITGASRRADLFVH